MWSGPRNISTAMMRSWGSRSDTLVVDEPFYGYYLHETGGLSHPGADEVIAAMEIDWRKVAEFLLTTDVGGRAIFYQKQMSHHMLPGVDLGWTEHVVNAFLIRNPREMLPSLFQNLRDPKLSDTGLPQQLELFEIVRKRLGTDPPIIDARDVLEHPREMLQALCQRLGVPFDEAMLSWEPGPRPTDGVWAKYWYANVERSTTFQPYTPKLEPVPVELRGLEEQCFPFYEELYAHRIRV